MNSAARGNSVKVFSSLRYRNFRLLWIGILVSHSGDWMDQIALSWLILNLTDSPFYVGLLSFFRLPILFLTPLGGVASDRWDRRRVMRITQTSGMCLAFLLGFLVLTGSIRLWEIYLIAGLRGAIMSFDIPARQALIPNLVPRSDLNNAIALNSATTNLTRILGPAAGGVLIAFFGVGWLFILNGLSFLVVIASVWMMRMPATNQERTIKHSGWHDLKDGVAYLRQDKFILYLILLSIIPSIFGQPYMDMLTVFARDVLDIGPTGLGLLTSTTALGSIISALAIARRREAKVSLMLGGLVFFGITLAIFAWSNSLWMSLLFLFLAGGNSMVWASTNSTLIQSYVPNNYRGRVLSLLFMNRGIRPIGSILVGWLAQLYGAPTAVGAMASIVAVLGGIAFFLRAKEPSPTIARVASRTPPGQS